jgi:hypothetical protein
MADIVRVSCGSRWTYVVVGSQEHGHLVRFAERGLTQSTASDVRLKSEAGPLFWEMIGDAGEPEGKTHSKVLECLADQGIGIGTEAILFGKHGENHDRFSDLSLVTESRSKKGTSPSDCGMDKDDVVLTAWPKNGRIVPALVTKPDRHFVLELVEDGHEGERCFVLDEEGGLITASLRSNGSEFLRMVPQLAFDSWLLASGCKSARKARFAVKDLGERMLIEDLEDGRSYTAPYLSAKKDLERQGAECLLAHGGIGAIIPKYELENA